MEYVLLRFWLYLLLLPGCYLLLSALIVPGGLLLIVFFLARGFISQDSSILKMEDIRMRNTNIEFLDRALIVVALMNGTRMDMDEV